MKRVSLVLATYLASPVSAYAQPALSEDTSLDKGSPAEDIVVTGHALRAMGLMAGSVELGANDLVRTSAPQIGDMLARVPGVSSTSFAPGASRPVLRGLTGDRVQVLLDGIGSIDASSVSADHGVALDTLTIDHIDVLHGPALLAYGGQAIGGAVNATDKRIPVRMPDGAFDATVIGGFASGADGKSLAGSIDLPLGSRIVVHGDASWRDANDMRIGGEQLSAPLHAQVLGLAADLRSQDDFAAADALETAAARRGRVPNTFAQGTSLGAGMAFIDANGSLGVSIQRIDNLYGIPARPGAGEGGVSIDLGQTRYDLRGHVDTGGFIESIQFRGAYGDYAHAELEEDGAVGTRFARKGLETRLELVQARRGGWFGRSGVQYSTGKLTVTGAEAILPANQDSRLGLFTLQSLKIGPLDLDAAARTERVSIRANPVGFRRIFSLQSAALGIAVTPLRGLKLGLNWSHGERAPSAEELLTHGLHVATQAYEIGDMSFGRETSNGLEAYARYEGEDTTFSLTGYVTHFTGFVTPLPTGDDIDGFPVYAYRQLPARFMGFEAQVNQSLARIGEGTLVLEASADHVHARLKGTGPVPRIPPLRVQGGLSFEEPDFDLRAGVEWNAAQNRVAAFENPTQAFTLVNMSADWRPMGKDGPLTLTLAADNLFDVIGRRSASYTRDFVPVAGRDIRLTARISL